MFLHTCKHEYLPYGEPIKTLYGHNGERVLVRKVRCVKCGKESTRKFWSGYFGGPFCRLN